jgi:hypothetical protein
MDEIDEFITDMQSQGYVTKEHVVIYEGDLNWLVVSEKQGKTFINGFRDYDDWYAVHDWRQFKKGVVWL